MKWYLRKKGSFSKQHHNFKLGFPPLWGTLRISFFHYSEFFVGDLWMSEIIKNRLYCQLWIHKDFINFNKSPLFPPTEVITEKMRIIFVVPTQLIINLLNSSKFFLVFVRLMSAWDVRFQLNLKNLHFKWKRSFERNEKWC